MNTPISLSKEWEPSANNNNFIKDKECKIHCKVSVLKVSIIKDNLKEATTKKDSREEFPILTNCSPIKTIHPTIMALIQTDKNSGNPFRMN